MARAPVAAVVHAAELNPRDTLWKEIFHRVSYNFKRVIIWMHKKFKICKVYSAQILSLTIKEYIRILLGYLCHKQQ